MTVLRRTLAAIIAAGDWDEEKHPRDDHGRFAPDGSGPTERDYAMPGKIQEEIHGKPPPEDGERELEHFDLGHPATQQDIDRFASRYPEGDPRRAKVEGLKPGRSAGPNEHQAPILDFLRKNPGAQPSEIRRAIAPKESFDYMHPAEHSVHKALKSLRDGGAIEYIEPPGGHGEGRFRLKSRDGERALKPGGPKQDGREFWRELAERASARRGHA